DELTMIRLARRDGMLYDALCAAAGEDSDPEGGSIPDSLREKCSAFLAFIRSWRRRALYAPVSEIVTALLEETGYQDYCEALPAGIQRSANLRLLRNQADAFTKTDFTGLFQFLRYIDGLQRQEIDYGEANTLDENADVVRIMTIHKSKGLEFPICFVAGLSKPFSFRRHDASGLMLYDSDWGVGVDYCDPVSRVRATTLRREELAEKIRRDCMGEELRVLYVAMTRAKEKLILTASVKNLPKKIESWQAAMSGFFYRPDDERLSPFMIGGASSYAQLICQAVLAHEGQEAALPQTNTFPMRITFCTPEDLSMQSAQEQLDLSRMEEILRGMEGHSLDDQPDPAAAHALADRIFRVYPHAELQDLYAQTSVSEIKHRAMREAMRSLREAADGTEEGSGTVEGAAELFPEETPVPYLPSFILREQAQKGEEQTEPEEAAGIPAPEPAGGRPEEAGGASEASSGSDVYSGISSGSSAGEGARRGTAFHRVLELMDYSRQEEFVGEGGYAAVSDWIRTLAESDRISEEDAGLVSIPRVRRFLGSALAARMGAADREGRLYREQPFVLGLSADRLDRHFPEDEMVTVQGIIDAFFIEDGAITLVDYKTDRVRTGQELTLRYSAQLALYAEALEKAFSLPVRERIIYSTALAEEIRLQT
ncbi:MAG: PD-(D/E)XK nuclease family protein, partial [Lachnospiraceae bacterium]|nr:PD-(D/E)XK nuclease family protein [Lachnospiraceae bacterium]